MRQRMHGIGTSCPKSQLKSTCLTAKFGSFLDHAKTGEKRTKYDQFFCPTIDFFDFCTPLVGIVIYLHIEGALYAQKSVPSWFLAVFDSKIDVC